MAAAVHKRGNKNKNQKLLYTRMKPSKKKILESILKVAKIKLNIRRFSLFVVQSSCRMFTCQSVLACVLNLALMKILTYMVSGQLPLRIFNCQVAETVTRNYFPFTKCYPSYNFPGALSYIL